MRVAGYWRRFDDGVVRPVIDAFVQKPDGSWEGIMFLLDSGADRTVLDVTLLSLLTPLALPADEAPHLAGVGGGAGCVFIQTRLSFLRSDGKRVSINGPFAVFTDALSSDVPVLGRDVTNNFDVIYSFPRREVALLTAPHSYLIQPSF